MEQLAKQSYCVECKSWITDTKGHECVGFYVMSLEASDAVVSSYDRYHWVEDEGGDYRPKHEQSGEIK